jgi:hypothetical protein
MADGAGRLKIQRTKLSLMRVCILKNKNIALELFLIFGGEGLLASSLQQV